jgi:hypothetical protein
MIPFERPNVSVTAVKDISERYFHLCRLFAEIMVRKCDFDHRCENIETGQLADLDALIPLERPNLSLTSVKEIPEGYFHFCRYFLEIMVTKSDFDLILTIDVMIPRLTSLVRWTYWYHFIGLTYVYS